MRRLLRLIARIRPWQLVCIAIGLIGAFWLWRSDEKPRHVSIVTVRIASDRETAALVEWKFTELYFIFAHSRRGEELWLDGIRILASNRTGRSLMNPKATVHLSAQDKDFPLGLALGNLQIDLSKGYKILPQEDFTLTYKFPSAIRAASGRIPDDDVTRILGSLTFRFQDDGGEVMTRYFSDADIQQQISKIWQSTGRPL